MTYRILDSIKTQTENVLKERFAFDILTGFTSPRKFISSKYFYDDKGSELFSEIMDQEDYYPTRCEREILENYKSQMSELLTNGYFKLIELGAGDGRKTQVLLKELLRQGAEFEYIPVDISEIAIKELSEKLERELPEIKVRGIVGEYQDALREISTDSHGKNAVLFLGSNLGNFSPPASIVFLRAIWQRLNNGDTLIIGFDLKKDIRVLTKAYNDKSGVTEEFNLNLLERINRELGGNFDRKNFIHHGVYNPDLGAMESFLISLKEQDIYITELEKVFHFNEYEPIHIEYSNKYLIKDIENLCNETGFESMENFTDKQGYFVDSVWRVKKTVRSPFAEKR